MKVALVGTGISGMLAAWLLAREHEVHVFEADERIGGHTNTVPVEVEGTRYDVDTGFIVYNDKTYPSFVRLLERLGVDHNASSMSFSVRNDATGLEYNGTSINTLFAQRRNLVRPSFWRMIRDILRFNREAPVLLDREESEVATLTLGDYLGQEGYSREFVEDYLVPMSAAVWSTPPGRMLSFPARTLVRFFHNHGFLQVEGRPLWKTIRGGSRTYAEKLVAPYRERIRLGSPVEEIRRDARGVDLRVRGGESERFDQVVIAAHSDQALAMLADASEAEREVLGAIPYQENEAILHSDTAATMPRARRAWASWNYHLPRRRRERATLTYWMNSLQAIEDAPVDFCVTLNPVEDFDQARVYRRITYHHPLFTPGAVAAQARYHEIAGHERRTHFCGAYWFYGFHEDGVKSALRVGRAFGVGLD